MKIYRALGQPFVKYVATSNKKNNDIKEKEWEQYCASPSPSQMKEYRKLQLNYTIHIEFLGGLFFAHMQNEISLSMCFFLSCFDFPPSLNYFKTMQLKV